MNVRPPKRSSLYSVSVWSVYIGVGASFLTGISWLLLDTFFQRAGDFGPEKHPAQSAILLIHGAVAMTMMMLFGGLLATHVRHYWRKKKSRKTGIALIATWTLLMISAYALYYSGHETTRLAAHWIHIALGIGLPVWLLLHLRQKVLIKRRQVSA